MEQMPYEEQLDDNAPRPMPPLLWVGLTTFFALCCCFFFVIASAEAILLFGQGGAGSPQSAGPTGTPAFGEIEFYLAQKSSTEPSGEPVTRAPTGTKTIYGFFTYKNMPKSGVKWSYEWMRDGETLEADSKSDLAWTREGNGRYSVRLVGAQNLAAGDYDLILKMNGKEVGAATFAVAAK